MHQLTFNEVCFIEKVFTDLLEENNYFYPYKKYGKGFEKVIALLNQEMDRASKRERRQKERQKIIEKRNSRYNLLLSLYSSLSEGKMPDQDIINSLSNELKKPYKG